jgi:hypothetical protein
MQSLLDKVVQGWTRDEGMRIELRVDQFRGMNQIDIQTEVQDR